MDDAKDDGRETKIVRLRVADDFADGGRVGGFEAATEREGEEFLRERADEQVGMFQQTRFESGDAGELAAVRQTAARIHGLAVFRGAPAADGVEEPELITVQVCGEGFCPLQEVGSADDESCSA